MRRALAVLLAALGLSLALAAPATAEESHGPGSSETNGQSWY